MITVAYGEAPFPVRPYLALVRVQRPTDILAVLAWDAVAPNELLPAMLRSWEDLFGARVVAFEGATLQQTSGCRTSKSTPDLLVSVSHARDARAG